MAMVLLASRAAAAADIWVPAGGNLQAAIDAARAGDTILLAPGATYVGNFRLPIHGGARHVTIRTAGNDALLPGASTRIRPSDARYLAKLRSPNTVSALRTEPGAAYWRVMLVEFLANQNGAGDVIKLGDGSVAQSSLAVVPRQLVLDRVYIHGDPLVGQKRGVYMNSAHTTIINSHISEMKAVAQDTQAIAGANGPGPFLVENNYLEAAGEVFIMGGDDPKIAGLVPADLVLRGNTLRRPVSWRNPIVPAPGGVTAAAATGGSLPAGTYAYRVTARRPAGTTVATSLPSLEVSVTTRARGGVAIRWNAVANATEYRVFGRTPGGQTAYWVVQGTSFTDSGAAGAGGTPPTSGTVWQVKNLFELKNCRRAVIEHNLMENNWLQAQAGIAILLSVRNQYGGCTQCVVEDVRFENNVVRNVGGGFSILGRDYRFPSQQTNNIRIRNNLFTGIDRAVWGGNGYFLTISEGPRDVVVDHNTVISPSGQGVIAVGAPVAGFVFTNNLALHHASGIAGAGAGYGTTAIRTYFPGSVIQRNVLAGGRASMYPEGNLFPTVAEFQAQFVDYAGGNFALRAGSGWAISGTNQSGLGATTGTLTAGALPEAPADTAPSEPAPVPPPAPTSSTSNRPPSLTVSSGSTGVVAVGAPVTLTAQATDSDGVVRSVDFFVNGVAAGSAARAPFTATWVVPQEGTHVVTAIAVDDDGASSTSGATITATAEVVLYATDASRLAGTFGIVADATAAEGHRLWNPDRGAAKILRPSATPANYAEFTFFAAAGRPYHLWIRGKGEGNAWMNDSAHLQFSGTVDASGVPVHRIGTTRGLWYSVEEYVNARLRHWGWQDNGFGQNVVGAPLYFERTGPQTLRIQQREDGVSIDQIVISPSRYFSVAPGLPKNDATIVSK
jgi:hypothetical protein